MIEWCPFAIRRDGPPEKFGYSNVGHPDYSPKRGEVKHSMVGSYESALTILDDLKVNSSWHFSIRKDGLIFQHYPLSANCWHANDTDLDDGVEANFDLVGVEHEGGGPGNESEPLTEPEISSTTAITAWLAQQAQLPIIVRFPDQVGAWALAEHNQVGNTPTACPSGRIPWGEIMARLHAPAQEEEDMAAIYQKPMSLTGGKYETYGFVSFPEPNPIKFETKEHRRLFSVVKNVQRGGVIPNDWARSATEEEWRILTGQD